MSGVRGVLVACTSVLVVVGAVPWARAEDKAKPVSEGVAAVVAGKAITLDEVDELVRNQLMDLRAREYQLRSQALDALVAQALIEKEAQARGTTAEALHKTEIEDKAVVSEAEAREFYEKNKGRFPAGTEEKAALAQIEEGLGRQRQGTQQAAFAKQLRAKYDVKVLLEPYRVPVDIKGAPLRGNPNAPVTVVEFSDFQCPYCLRARPTVNQVREVYGDKVRWVFRHFPLSFHAQAEKAGEAAACAGDQGKFWEMHDALWASGGKLAVPDLKASAGTIGLDTAAFDQCLDSGRHAGLLEKDIEAGQGYGVSGTPAFFVNGRPLVGAQPYEAFAQVIDDELERVGVPVPVASAK
jgi:protein-disulfide isomerase